MQILQIDRDGEELIQGFVRAEWPQRADIVGGRANAWARMFTRSAALWNQAKPLSVALRISIEPGRPVVTVHSFVCAKTDEQRLRLVLAAFMRTDQMGAGYTEGPQRGDTLVRRFIHPEEPRLTMSREKLKTGNGLAIHHNLRLADQLPRLLQTFADLGVPFAYEMQVAPWTPPRERLREFLHGTARFLDARGIPAGLSDDQAALAERVKRSSYHMEECLSAPSPQYFEMVRETLSSLLSETLYGRMGITPHVDSIEDDRAEAFAHHVHSHLVLEAQPVSVAEVAAAATREDVDECLSCTPLGFDLTAAGPPVPGGGRPPTSAPIEPRSTGPGASASPAAGPSGSPFLFISYARADGDRVYPIVEQISARGASVWIDRRIIGGEDWISELENQLIRCDGVLAFISPSFASSRYCCREVRFADTLDKRIIPIVLQPAELGGGMKFILHAVQSLIVTQALDYDVIISAIRKHAPNSLSDY